MNKKKILPPTYSFISLTLIVLIHFVFPIAKFIKFPLNLIGLLPLLSGIVLNILADNSFKKYSTTVKPFEESAVLVTSGTFRISRNPMYLGMALILLGVCILLGSVSPYFVMIVFSILIDFNFIRVEEKMMEEKFRSKWLEYKKTTRRWL
jgi:protein-S-isoprenylcysteine O-methyltransferase Ste14